MPHKVQRVFLAEEVNDAGENPERIAYNGTQNNAGHSEIFCQDDRTEDVAADLKSVADIVDKLVPSL